MTNDNTESTPTASTDRTAIASAGHAGLREHAYDLGDCDPGADLSADSLPDDVHDAAVIALGEGTHGTREFFRLKHRLLRYLVTEAGVRTFAMEANMPEAAALDEYVVHGRGDPETGLEELYFWTWQTEELLALVEWLRAFNEGRPLDDRVRFRGFDAQYTQGAVDALSTYFGEDLPAGVVEDLELTSAGGTAPVRDDRVPERIDAAERVVHRLREVLGNGEATERPRRWLRVIEQATEYRRRTLDWQSADDDSDEERAAMEALLRVRDRAMAENVEWLEERTDGPVVLWGHDAHINRDRHAYRGYDVAAPSMGSHLVGQYGDDYYAVGFSFARGTFQAIDRTGGDRGLTSFTLDDPLSGTIESAMDEADLGTAMLDLRAGAEDPRLDDWLTTRRERFSIGATYDGDPGGYLTAYPLVEAFDAICFVPDTTRARPL